jgi:uncharacterized protein YbbK (DUF523 family)
VLGTPCRYDGKSKPCAEAIALRERFDLIPVCPETDGGLPTPRPPCEIQGERVKQKDGSDMTDPYEKGARIALRIAKENACKMAVLKEKSPSCGKHFRYDGSFQGVLIDSSGITAQLLQENGIKIYSENEIDKIKETR